MIADEDSPKFMAAAFLLAVSRVSGTNLDIAHFFPSVEALSATEVVNLAKSQMMSPALGWLISRADYVRSTFAEHEDVLLAAWSENIARTSAHAWEAKKITEALAGAEIDAVVTKGNISHARIYGGYGVRAFGDVDFMIRRKDAASAVPVIESCGFAAASRFDLATNTVIPLPRTETMVYKLFPDHLPPFCRLADGPVSYIRADVAFSMTWAKSPWQMADEAYLDDPSWQVVTTEEGDIELPALAPAYDLLFTLMHSFRESWLLTRDGLSRVRINHLADAWRMWATFSEADRDQFASLVEANGMQLPVAWALARVEDAFGVRVNADLGLSAFAQPEWVNTVKGADGEYFSWSGSTLEAVSSGGRVALEKVDTPRMVRA
ncbi:nucleotidyltransferase family protein [Microbacterium sp. P04]|uniref:nucleotidyltransferase family protein n=1 Tax=Microbacterium sp. P04 TaxID=3366947 RepID=UPI003744C330